MKRCCRLAILALSLISAASADVVTIPLNYVFSGNAATDTYFTATFRDTADGVLLTMDASGLSAGQYVSNWAFNLNPLISPSSLVIQNKSGAQAAAVNTGTDVYKADGDGRYDIQFAFDTNSFAGGTSSTYLITCTGCTAQSFSFLSTRPSGDPIDYKGPFYSAAQVQNGPWIGARDPLPPATVPESTSYPVYILMMLGFCAGIFQRVRSRAQ